MTSTDTCDTTHRQLAELQRTVATKATQLEQLVVDISRLVGDADQAEPPSPWSALLDADFRTSWRELHRGRIRQVVGALEDQAAHLGDLRRHLLPAPGHPVAPR